MPQKTNLNVSPYFDDFDTDKNFYKVLFRPGYSVQTRELTSLQSILQNQIESYGKYRFKQGQLVIPGEVGLNNRLNFVKLSSVSEVAVNENGAIVYKKYDIKQLIGSTLRGINSGVSAVVVEVKYATEESADLIFVNYINSGDDGNESTFRQGETLEVVGGVNTPLLVVGTDGSVLPTSIQIIDPDTGDNSSLSSPAMGYATALKVEEGIYFVNGFFVRNDEQLIVLNNYYDKASVKVGFAIVEDIITPEEDASLYDNARGYSNSSAPGAHRLKIKLELKKFEYKALTDKNFIQIIQIKNGVVEKQIKPADYTLLEETLARRTYDESGDYVVKDFTIDTREYYQRNGNNGIYKQGDNGLVKGLSATEAETKLVVSVSPGKAYVRGFEIVNKEVKYLTIEKARDTLTRDNVTVKSRGASAFKVSNVYGTVPLNTVAGELSAYPDVYLNAVFNDGSIGFNGLEEETSYKFTTSRRAIEFGLDKGLKTIMINVTEGNADPVVKSDFPTKLWYVKSRSGSTPTSAGYIDIVAFSNANDINVAGTTSYFVEATIYGERSVLDEYFVEYDEGDPSKYRILYKTEADVLPPEGYTPELSYGRLVSYTNTITPTIGVVKPKDFSLSDRPDGFSQDTDKIISRGKSGVNAQPYSGIFNFGYFNPTFFTRITLETTPAEGFGSGKYIYGKTSNAVGVIENDLSSNYSSGSKLFVTTIAGQFHSGETIFDEQGFSIKIAKDNTISHFICTKRGTGYGSDDSTSLFINGNEINNSKVAPRTSGQGIYRIEVLDRSALRETFIAPPQVKAFPIQESAANNPSVIPVLYKNTVLTYTPQNVKSLQSTYNNYKFTADVDFSKTKYSDYRPITNFSFSGKQGSKFLECSGFGANLSKDLIQGDIIQYTDGDDNIVKNIVQWTSDAEGTVKSRIYLTYSLRDDVTNISVVRVRPLVSNVNASLIFPTGSKQIASLVRDSSDTKIKYYVRKDFTSDLNAAGGVITFTAQLPVGFQRFVAFNENAYVLTVLEKGDSDVVETGDIVYIDPKFVSINSSTSDSTGVTAGSLVIQMPQNFFGIGLTVYPKLKLTASVEIDQAKPRLKTAIRNQRIVIISGGDRVIPLRGSDYDGVATAILSYSDAFKLRYVYEGSSTTPPDVDSAGNLISGTDVTYKFSFDDGQRDTLYDVSRLVLKPGFESTQGQLVVAFDYFEHSSGDFCTVDSYTHEAGVEGSEVPSFNSSVHGIVSLKDVLDFRPKVDSSTTVTGFQDVSILSNPSGASYINFTGDSGVTALTPASDPGLEYSMSFSETQYLDRIDGIFLNKKGEFVVKKGNASLNPAKPDNVDDAITIAYLHIPAFTKSNKDVRIVPVDNRRYTMRDIGKLEKRIERLEYYTTLSILEQQTLNMQIKDTVGFDRFKSGFIVDNFEGHGIGNIISEDYKCSIDTQQSVLRPSVKENSINLREVNTRNDQRLISGYVNNSNVITLPYTSLKLLGNEFATKTINPNPFVVIQYVGDCSISPTIDQWYNTDIAPLALNTNTNHYAIFQAKNDVRDAIGSIFNSFIVNWTGSDSSLMSINSFATVTSDKVESFVQKANIASSSNVSPQNNEIAKGVTTKTVNGVKVSSSLEFFARSIPVFFKVQRLKADTKLNVYIDGRSVNPWVVPDSNFSGIAGNSLTTFGSELKTNSNGDLSGMILIPSGYEPVSNSRWYGNSDNVDYNLASEEIYIAAGEKTITFTDTDNYDNKSESNSYADVIFYSTGIIPENPSSIVSTTAAYFKANEGVQSVNSNTDKEVKPNPLAQTFKIENFSGGCFTTGIDLFFKNKDTSIPIKTYLTNVDTGKPGKHVIPGSTSIKYPETYLKIFVTGDNDTISIKKNEFVKGSATNASGPILRVFDKNNIQVGDENSLQFQLNKEQVYTLILENHNGISFIANEQLIIPSVTEYNNTRNKEVLINIAKDSGKLVELQVEQTGSNYETAAITIESPQLPGGSTATGNIYVSDGQIYSSELVLSGRGYTEAPSVVIKGVGLGAGDAIITSRIEIDTPAVRMGVATDANADTPSTVPTHFDFKHPVYLQNDTEYALVVETDSIEYDLWVSRLGETEVATSTTVNSQPLLGSVYKSQNIDNWTEDLFEDIKFTLYRAEFDTSSFAQLLLTNEDLGFEKLDSDPFESSVRSNSNATSDLFKNNNKLIKVFHRDHGFEDTLSSVYFRGSEDTGGISSTVLNAKLFTVKNSGLDNYVIELPSRAGSSLFGGGDKVFATYNRKYEKLYAQISYLQLEGTTIDTEVETTNITPLDSNSVNFPSYTQSTFEKTFLNQEHFFTNQKIISSKINETMNNVDRSLTYKINLTSTVSYLSPVIDLNIASVKTSTNRIDNSTGQEKRFGKKYQKLTFLPVYNLGLNVTPTGADTTVLVPGVTLEGVTSQASGTLLSYDSNIALISLTSSVLFKTGEILIAKNLGGVRLTGISLSVSTQNEQKFSFTEGTNVFSYFPSNFNYNYANIIDGKVISWDSDEKELIVENPYAPIDGNYDSAILKDSNFVRKQEDQESDIFRVGDIVKSQDDYYVTITGANFENGADFTAETDSKNSSSLAKYVSKEVSINEPGTSIDVRLTVNVKTRENIQVLYKTKETSAQLNFEDINWTYFNDTGYSDNNDLATAENSISAIAEDQASYQEYKFSVQDISEFTSFAIKIVMKSDDPAYAPKIQDMRSVASY